jgi:hypothetical protein
MGINPCFRNWRKGLLELAVKSFRRDAILKGRKGDTLLVYFQTKPLAVGRTLKRGDFTTPPAGGGASRALRW